MVYDPIFAVIALNMAVGTMVRGSLRLLFFTNSEKICKFPACSGGLLSCGIVLPP
jgi:hypothetical protein